MKNEFGIIIKAEVTARKEFRRIITNVMVESRKVMDSVEFANKNILELGLQENSTKESSNTLNEMVSKFII